jgi:predicted membrane protein
VGFVNCLDAVAFLLGVTRLKCRCRNTRNLRLTDLPYCPKCGAKLEEYDRFCPKCGTPAISAPPTAPSLPKQSARPLPPLRKDPLILAGIALIVILVTAVVAAVFLVAPMSTWDFSRSLEDKTPNVETLNLNFETNIGEVNVTPLEVGNNNIGIYVTANGSRGMFGDSEIPVSVSFNNQTVGDTLTVNSKVSFDQAMAMRVNVRVEIFVNPTLNLNLNITTDAGSINLAADRATTFQSLNLQTHAGSVEASIHNAVIAGNVTLSTNAGSVYFGMSQSIVEGNRTVNVESNAGSVTLDIAQTKFMQGNLQVIAETYLGSVDVGLEIDGDVGAKITSRTNLGSINANTNNFSGNQTPIQSNNYPAASNIEIYCTTNLGSVNIDADYQSNQQPNIINN